MDKKIALLKINDEKVFRKENKVKIREEIREKENVI